MPQPDRINPRARRRLNTLQTVIGGLALALLIFAGVAAVARDAASAGTLVVIQDVSSMGGGSFSGNVCYQVVRDNDGITISEGCFSVPASIAAPEGMEIGVPYSIYISLADIDCILYDDIRNGDGSEPFLVRVSCDPSFMTATAEAQPSPTETPPPPTETPAETPTPFPTAEPTVGTPTEPPPTVEPTSETPPTETPVPTDEPPSEPIEATEPPVDEEATEPAYDVVPVAETTAPVAVTISSLAFDPASGAPGRTEGAAVLTYLISDLTGAQTIVSLSSRPADDVQLLAVGDPSVAIAACPVASAFGMPVALSEPVPLVTCERVAEAPSTGSFQQTVSFDLPADDAGQPASADQTLVITITLGPGA